MHKNKNKKKINHEVMNSVFLSTTMTFKKLRKKMKRNKIYSLLTIEKNLTSFLHTSKTKASVVLTHGDRFQKNFKRKNSSPTSLSINREANFLIRQSWKS